MLWVMYLGKIQNPLLLRSDIHWHLWVIYDDDVMKAPLFLIFKKKNFSLWNGIAQIFELNAFGVSDLVLHGLESHVVG